MVQSMDLHRSLLSSATYQASPLTSLCFSFLICKMAVVTVVPSPVIPYPSHAETILGQVSAQGIIPGQLQPAASPMVARMSEEASPMLLRHSCLMKSATGGGKLW